MPANHSSLAAGDTLRYLESTAKQLTGEIRNTEVEN